MKLQPFSGSPGKSVEPEQKDLHEHFQACPVCGQRFDVRKLDEVIYHKGLPHALLERDE